MVFIVTGSRGNTTLFEDTPDAIDLNRDELSIRISIPLQPSGKKYRMFSLTSSGSLKLRTKEAFLLKGNKKESAKNIPNFMTFLYLVPPDLG